MAAAVGRSRAMTMTLRVSITSIRTWFASQQRDVFVYKKLRDGEIFFSSYSR